MAKIPYLIRRKNVFYFRMGVPVELREKIKCREIIQSLGTQNSEEAERKALKLAAHFKALLHELKTGKHGEVGRIDFSGLKESESVQNIAIAPAQTLPESFVDLGRHQAQERLKSPLLSFVVSDFLNRYYPSNKATLTKLNATLPLLIELVGNNPVNQILQTDLNSFFDDVQKLPVKRSQKIFEGLTLREIIAANTGQCIAEGTFESTYKACISIFLNWANSHYRDQGFPSLTVQGAVFRGERKEGVNKQRAATDQELQRLFGHPKMQRYANNPETVHYFWLPLVGLYTGARINEICQLNPQQDIKQDPVTGIHYFHFTDAGEVADGVSKSIKTQSSRRVVPIHSKLIEFGFLDYVEKVRKAGHKIIFPAWQPRNGKASPNAQKWFVRYLDSIDLRSEEQGARLSGFHLFRHSFVTFGMNNKIGLTFELTGHDLGEIEGQKLSNVAKGYWSRGLTNNIRELKAAIESFNFDLLI